MPTPTTWTSRRSFAVKQTDHEPLSPGGGRGGGVSPVVTYHGKPPTHLTVDALDAAGLRHAFTTRHHARAITDRSASPALRALGDGEEGVRWARQVHGATCLIADGRPPGEVGEADALITTRRGA